MKVKIQDSELIIVESSFRTDIGFTPSYRISFEFNIMGINLKISSDNR
jgi:hypothetical protein